MHLTRSARTRRTATGTALALAVAVTAACSSGGSGGSSGGSTTADGAGLAAARSALEPYTGHPSPFPATEKLAKRPAPGSKFVFMQCSAPVCALFAQLMTAPAQALGVGFQPINSGSSATSTQAAASSALSQKPTAVLIGASNPQLYGDYLHKLVAGGAVVAGGGTVGGTPYGVQEAVGGEHSVGLAGQLLADWVTARGQSARVAFFGTPELTFSSGLQTSFADTLKQHCPSCSADYRPLSVTTFGTTAPGQVVSYLQSHPKTDTVVFASMEGATGLAAALRNAHLSPTTVGFAPTPSNLQDISSGGLTAGLALDFNVQVWMQFNLAARLLAGQRTPASNLSVDLQFLTKDDLAGRDLSRGWTGYPDVARRFAELWGEAQ